MKFLISKNILLKYILKIFSIINIYHYIPVFTGIKFTIRENKLFLVATDASIATEIRISKNVDSEFKIFKEGEFLIKANFILNLLKNLDDKVIFFELKKNFLLINGKFFNLKLCLMKNKDFPQIFFNVDSENKVKISNLNLKEVLEIFLTYFRNKSNCLNFMFKNDKLYIIFQSYYQVSLISFKNNQNKINNFSIHYIFLKKLLHLLEPNNDFFFFIEKNNLYIFENNTIVILKVQDSKLSLSLVDNLKKTDYVTELKINCLRLFFPFKRIISLFLSNNQDENLLISNMVVTNKYILLNSNLPQIGVIDEKINTLISCSGPEQNFFVSLQVIFNILKTIKLTNELILLIKNSFSPILIKTQNNNYEVKHWILSIKN